MVLARLYLSELGWPSWFWRRHRSRCPATPIAPRVPAPGSWRDHDVAVLAHHDLVGSSDVCSRLETVRAAEVLLYSCSKRVSASHAKRTPLRAGRTYLGGLHTLLGLLRRHQLCPFSANESEELTQKNSVSISANDKSV